MPDKKTPDPADADDAFERKSESEPQVRARDAYEGRAPRRKSGHDLRDGIIAKARRDPGDEALENATSSSEVSAHLKASMEAMTRQALQNRVIASDDPVTAKSAVQIELSAPGNERWIGHISARGKAWVVVESRDQGQESRVIHLSELQITPKMLRDMRDL